MTFLKEEFEQLNELMTKVSNILSPHNESDLAWLQKKDILDKLRGKFPKCFISLKSGYGDEIPYFCVCNRMGIHDPNVINSAIKMIEKMKDNENLNQDEISQIRLRLRNMSSRYNKEVPTSFNSSTTKGIQTKKINRIRKYIEDLRKNK